MSWLGVDLSRAQSEVQTREGQQRRMIAMFDFEERDDPQPNYESLPKFWYPIGRPPSTTDPNFLQQPLHRKLTEKIGYPDWNAVRFDTRRAASGRHSFFLGVDSGHTGAFAQIGALPAVPSSDYLVTFKLNTTQFEHAHARVKAYLATARGEKIAASQMLSPPLRSVDHWQEGRIRLFGDFPGAAWIVIELHVKQPEADPDDPLGEYQVVREEVRGGAWFDDVTVWQLPRVTVKTQSEVNVIRRPESPELEMFVRDLSGQPLRAQVKVYDVDRQLVAQAEKLVGRRSPPRWRWTPALDRLGWYLADLQVFETSDSSGASEAGGALARNLTSFLWMQPEPGVRGDELSRFTIDASRLGRDELRLTPELMRQARLSSLILSAWDRRSVPETVSTRAELLDKIFRAVPTSGRRGTISLDPLPQAMLRHLETDARATLTPLTLLANDSGVWRPFITPLTMRNGQTVHRWRLGETIGGAAFFHPKLDRLLRTATDALQRLTPNPHAMIGWSLLHARRRELDSRFTVAAHVPASVRPATIDEYMAPWREPPRTPVDLRLAVRPASELTQRRRVTDLALRMVHGWSAEAAGLTLPTPWTRAVERKARLMPDPLLGVFTTGAYRLADRRAVDEMWIGRGRRCLVFDGRRGGMLVAWNENADANEKDWIGYLGRDPIMIDVWGNRAAAPTTEGGRHRLPLDKTPIFIEGVDTRLAIFRARFELDSPFINSIHAPQQATLSLHNPWPQTISGRMRIREPDSWRIQPRTHLFSIAAGDTKQIQLQLMFPVGETAGPKKLVADFDFTADRQYTVQLAAPMELGLKGVSLDPTLTLDKDPQTGVVDAVVTLQVTNHGKEAKSLFAFANLYGRRREQRLIQELTPGLSTIRRIRFQDVGELLQEHDIRVGLREAEGEAVINKILSLDKPQ